MESWSQVVVDFEDDVQFVQNCQTKSILKLSLCEGLTWISCVLNNRMNGLCSISVLIIIFIKLNTSWLTCVSSRHPFGRLKNYVILQIKGSLKVYHHMYLFFPLLPLSACSASRRVVINSITVSFSEVSVCLLRPPLTIHLPSRHILSIHLHISLTLHLFTTPYQGVFCLPCFSPFATQSTEVIPTMFQWFLYSYVP